MSERPAARPRVRRAGPARRWPRLQAGSRQKTGDSPVGPGIQELGSLVLPGA
jgi:hypothetical protein